MSFAPPSSSMMPSSCSSGVFCDDIWKKFDDFLLTPPQSPPVLKFDLNNNCNDDDMEASFNMEDLLGPDALEDLDLSAALDGLLDEVSCLSDHTMVDMLSCSPDTASDVLHDCMWSSVIMDDTSKNRFNLPPPMTTSPSSRSPYVSSDISTPLMSSLCPDMIEDNLVSGDSGTSSMADDDEVPTIDDSEDEEESSQLFVSSGSESLIDHSYGFSSNLMMRNQKTYGSSISNKRKTSSASSTSTSLLASSSPMKKARKLAQQAYKEQISETVSVKFVKTPKTKRRKTSVSSPLCSSSPSCSGSLVVSRSPRKSTSPYAVANILSNSNSMIASSKAIKKKQVKKPEVASASLFPLKSAGPSTCKISNNPVTVSSVAASILKCEKSDSSASSVCSSSSSLTCSSISPKKSMKSRKSSGNSSTSSNSIKLVSLSSCVLPEKEKRREHNDSEKKRRDHLRNAFHSLRDQIPKLVECSKKPARIVILYEAAAYVNELAVESALLEKQNEIELQRKANLEKRLAQLQALK